jgi:MoxR-like ATPase
MSTAKPRSLGDILQEFSQHRKLMQEELQKIIIGQNDVIEQLFAAIFTRGHCLLEGVPGLAKTLMVSTLARILDVGFKRIQFTPDLMPSDITGTNVLEEDETGRRNFRFVEGPIFTNILLADEINRTPPRTQASLLEAMQERTVTVDGKTHRLPDPFLVIATQNPYEQEGIFALPESQLDRFLFKINLDYTDAEHEIEMLRLPHTGVTPDMLGEIQSLLGVVGLERARNELDETEVPREVAEYIVKVVRATRENPQVELGASSRAAIHLLSASKAEARLDGRSSVTVADVRSVAPHVLRHRLICRSGTTPDEALRTALDA